MASEASLTKTVQQRVFIVARLGKEKVAKQSNMERTFAHICTLGLVYDHRNLFREWYLPSFVYGLSHTATIKNSSRKGQKNTERILKKTRRHSYPQ